MAQFFYDLSIGKPGEWPIWFKGNRPDPFADGTVPDNVLTLGPCYRDPVRTFRRTKINSATWHMVPTFGLNESDVEVLLKAKHPTLTSINDVAFNNTGAAGIMLRCTTGAFTSRPPTSYYMATGSTGGNESTFVIFKIDTPNSLSQSMLLSPVVKSNLSYPQRADSFSFLRFRCNGNTLQAKLWHETETEPGTWGFGTTDNDISGPGDIGIYFSAYVYDIEYAFVSIGTGGDSAPSSFPGGNRTIAGTLLKPDSSPAEDYLVRCYHRESGALLGETLANSIGAFTFSLPIPSTEKVYCLGVDQLGNTWNAPIKDLLSPV